MSPNLAQVFDIIQKCVWVQEEHDAMMEQLRKEHTEQEQEAAGR